jgi:uncharacterized protein YciI
MQNRTQVRFQIGAAMHSRMAYIKWALLAILLVTIRADAQPPSPAAQAGQSRSPVFVAFYERGPAWDAAKDTFHQTSIPEHMQFLRGNADTLVGAAPFQQGLAVGGSDRAVGMVIVMAASQADAEKLIAGDPAIVSKVMTATVRRWLVERLRAY